MTWTRCLPTVGLLIAAVAVTALPARAIGWTERVTVSSTGEEANGPSDGPLASLSADGRFFPFCSHATNLVPGDTNDSEDIFVYDRQTRTTERVSVTSTGEQVHGGGIGAVISADGWFVSWQSGQSDLIPGQAFSGPQIVIHDRHTGANELISVSGTGGQPNGWSFDTVVSSDGRFVLFDSEASNLVPWDTNSAWYDAFVRDRQTGTTELVSISSSEEQGNDASTPAGISADGRFAAFYTASSLVTEDSNGMDDVFVRDRQAGATERVSVSSTGEQGDGNSYARSMSADGRFIGFYSDATNLVSGDTNGQWDAFVHDRQTGITERVSVSTAGEQGNGGSDGCWASTDGRFVVFSSDATNLVPGDTNGASDIFVRDRQTGTTERVSVSSTGEQGDGPCSFAAISADGRVVAFFSQATNLVPGDTNGVVDGFVRVRWRFADVPSYFWAFEQVEACAEAGIVKGYTDGLYHPTDPVSRGQMAVYISRALCGGDANVPEGPAQATFEDVPIGHWGFKYVEYAVSQGVVAGYDATHYQPDPLVDRGQMAVFISRALVAPAGDPGVPDPGCTEAPFPDVPCDFWARKHIQYIKSEGVTGGYLDGKYHPEYPVTRDAMAVYIARAFQLPL